jgi:hypothetical protein
MIDPVEKAWKEYEYNRTGMFGEMTSCRPRDAFAAGWEAKTRRHLLPARRHSETFTMRFWNQDWSVTVGYYEDDVTVGEVFVNATKNPGTELESQCRDTAILFSLCIQHGVPLDTITGALTRNQNGSASAIMGAIADRLVSKRPNIEEIK